MFTFYVVTKLQSRIDYTTFRTTVSEVTAFEHEEEARQYINDKRKEYWETRMNQVKVIEMNEICEPNLIYVIYEMHTVSF